MKAAIWARVSSSDQHAANQLQVLRAWAESRGLEVVVTFETEDSASVYGQAKGNAEFERARRALLNGARLGEYKVVLIWALDRLSRLGGEDTLSVLRRFAEYGTDVWSHEEDWLRTSSPDMRELLTGIFGWMAKQESARRSERVKIGMARAKAEGKRIGGKKPGDHDSKPGASQRRSAAVSAAWSGPTGEARREALRERNRARANSAA